LKEHDKLIPLLERLVEMEPYNVPALENLAVSYMQAGQVKKAEVTYANATDLKEKIDSGEIDVTAAREEKKGPEKTIEVVSETGEKIDTEAMAALPDHEPIKVDFTERQVKDTWGEPNDTRRTQEYLQQTSRSARDQLVSVNVWSYENFKFGGNFWQRVNVVFSGTGRVVRIETE